jgi:Ca2+/H+ antiporter
MNNPNASSELPTTTINSPLHIRQLHAVTSFVTELWSSTDLVFRQNKLTLLLVLGPIAVVGSKTQWLGEAACFALAGAALIPCAERLSFITEQVALHTNGTIGALLNATFGNAPELLISVAALRSGYYRVVQLAMLGSMLTNLILVFGVACVIGGLRWQVQELRLTSGNVNVGMLLVATAGFLLPAALVLSGQLPHEREIDKDVPSRVEVAFCRVNAFVMMILYVCYLIFQLGTHKEEFDDEGSVNNITRKARRNLFCLTYFQKASQRLPSAHMYSQVDVVGPTRAINATTLQRSTSADDKHPVQIQMTSIHHNDGDRTYDDNTLNFNANGRDPLEKEEMDDQRSIPQIQSSPNRYHKGSPFINRKLQRRTEHNRDVASISNSEMGLCLPTLSRSTGVTKSKESDTCSPDDDNEFDDEEFQNEIPHLDSDEHRIPLISMRVGCVWLFVITLCISAMSDVLVDTIDGFARRMDLSEVFTSMVIIPFFSNVAEQVSAFIFAYRNEMDLVVGVTVGSAVQIATFVLPGSVLAGMMMDRSMTLYFHGYETACLFFGVVAVGAVLQGGTTNWMVGASKYALA